MSFFHENMLIGSSGQGGAAGYQIERSLRFNSADSAYLSRTPASASNRRTFTFSFWMKRSADTSGRMFGLTDATSNERFEFMHSNNSLYLFAQPVDKTLFSSSSFVTNALLRDFSAWYHVVLSIDTTQATNTERLRCYLNGTRLTFSSATYPTQNNEFYVNTTKQHLIGLGAGSYFDGYLADFHFIDGQALTPASFGEFDTNNVWQPKAYTGTYGTNGFRLDFSDNSAATATTLGKDRAGSNNWTPVNLSVTAGAGNDSLTDSPSNYGTDTGAGGTVRGNYCTWNPLNSTSGFTLVNGNLELTGSGGGGTFHNSRGTFALNDAKFYWETVVAATKTYQHWGIVPTDTPLETGGSEALGQTEIPNSVAIVCGTGNIIENSNTLSAGSGALSTNDIIGHAFDGTTGKYWISINGVWRTGNPSAGTTPLTTVSLSRTWLCGVSEASSQTLVANFGQRQWAYAAPAGFKALCTQNLPTPTITNGATVMDVKLYTGTGSARTLSGFSFSPDLLWFKARSANYSHQLYDSVRGTNKVIYSNLTDAELTVSSGVTAFNSDGVSVGTEDGINGNAITYAAWAWDAGSSTVTNTSGTISSQVRANASAGFSVVTYTGNGVTSTVGHGLGVKPALIFLKTRSVAAQNWYIYHSSLGATKGLFFTASAAITDSYFWNNTEPTSTVFTASAAYANSNQNNATYVAFCWAPVASYSAFGSYTGNGSTDGPFIFCNFRPRFILIKSSSLALDWCIFDAARDGYNADNDSLYPNSSQVENNFVLSSELDILSNGFKPRANRDRINQSAATYVWAAFAEHPFALARAR